MMNLPSFHSPDLPTDLGNQCPLCGSDQFDAKTSEAESCFVTQTCSVCGLTCRVVVGPESLPVEARMSEWASVFVHD